VVNGLPLAGAAAVPAVAVVPAGTGNDFMRGLGLPAHPVSAAQVLADCQPRRIDLLDCGTRRAANGVNAGFAAAATERLSARVKRALGPLGDALGGVAAGLDPPSWDAHVEVEVDDDDVRFIRSCCRG
jgi:diacylglycerol kinase (ATP)